MKSGSPDPDTFYATNPSTLLRSSPRKHEQIAKGYLRGRYGAISAMADKAAS